MRGLEQLGKTAKHAGSAFALGLQDFSAIGAKRPLMNVIYPGNLLKPAVETGQFAGGVDDHHSSPNVAGRACRTEQFPRDGARLARYCARKCLDVVKRRTAVAVEHQFV